jgi:DNA-binding response OmpR family regulator
MPLIIIADDDPLVVEIVRAALEARGHVVGELHDGKSVKQVVELKQPNVVILDCTMAEVSGIIALKEIRASTIASTTPVLMLTARRGEADEGIARYAGADDYLRKPFDPDELVVRVELLIEKYKAAARQSPAEDPADGFEPRVSSHRR